MNTPWPRSREVEKPKKLPVDPDIAAALKDVAQELQRVRLTKAPFHSAHEGFAVLQEEVEELWDEVRKRGSLRSRELLRAEAVQVAAMAVKFITDVCQAPAEAGPGAPGIHSPK